MLRMSLVECRLETGRTHQIRVHLKFKEHQLLEIINMEKKVKNSKKLMQNFIEYSKILRDKFYMLKLLNFNILLKTSGLNLHQNYHTNLKEC